MKVKHGATNDGNERLNMTPTKIGFEKQYADGSGVEFSVYYYDAEPGVDQIAITRTSQIAITRVSSVSLPIDQLDWLIECLQKIRQEVAPVPEPDPVAEMASLMDAERSGLREELAASFFKSTEKG